MIKTDLFCGNQNCRHADGGVCVIRVPYYPGEAVDWCSYFESTAPAVDPDEIMQSLHDCIMTLATDWATGGGESDYYMALGAIYARGQVCMTVSGDFELARVELNKYLPLLGWR